MVGAAGASLPHAVGSVHPGYDPVPLDGAVDLAVAIGTGLNPAGQQVRIGRVEWLLRHAVEVGAEALVSASPGVGSLYVVRGFSHRVVRRTGG